MKMLGCLHYPHVPWEPTGFSTPVSYSPPRYPGTKASPCEVQTTGDLSEALLPSGLNVSHVSTRASHLPSPPLSCFTSQY